MDRLPTLGPYRLLDTLGAGGMGIVYRAVQTTLNREVALKVLRTEIEAHAPSRRRFEREMRTAAAMSHPNLVKVFDGGTLAGFSYIAMELLEGHTLRPRSPEHGPMPWGPSLRLIRGVVAGLKCLHSQEILHRDIKPSNIFVTRSGDVKLLDFGLVLALKENRLTEPGVVLGTWQYIAPEIFLGQEPTPATDLWSVGCVLHELLSGEHPFPETEVTTFLRGAVGHRRPHLSARIRDLPSSVDELLDSLLKVDPARRLSDAQELLARVDGLLSAPTTWQTPREVVMVQPGPGEPDPETIRLAPEPGRRRGFRRLAPLGLALLGSGALLLAGTSRMRSPAEIPGKTAPSRSPAAAPVRDPPAGLDTVGGGWRAIAPLQARIESEPSRERALVEELRHRTGIDLGPGRTPWIYWIQLGRWLEREPATRLPPRARGAATGPIDTLLGSPVFGFMAEVDPHPPGQMVRPGASARAAVLLLNMQYPDDASTWLALGRFLECEANRPAATRAYARALALEASGAMAGAPHALWTALARALLCVPGHTLEAEWFDRVHSAGGESNAWTGLVEALPGPLWPRLRVLLERGLKDPASAVPAAVELGAQIWVNEMDHPGALAVWESVLRAHPGAPALHLAMAYDRLSHGQIDDPDGVFRGIPADHWVHAARALVGDPYLSGSRPGAEDVIDLWILALLERKDLARVREVLASPAGRAAAEKSPRIAFELLAAGHRDEALEKRAARALAGSAEGRGILDLAGVLTDPALASWAASAFKDAGSSGRGTGTRDLALALWHSRQGHHPEALDALDRAVPAGAPADSAWDVILEVQARLLWYRMTGRPVDAGLLRRVRLRPAPTGPPRLHLAGYWSSLLREDRGGALSLSRQAFDALPCTPALILAYAYAAALDPAAGPGALRQCRAASRHGRQGLWILRELDWLRTGKQLGP